jgi:hypothetical protein
MDSSIQTSILADRNHSSGWHALIHAEVQRHGISSVDSPP